MLYLWRSTTANYLNIGSSGNLGGITLWNGSYHTDIVPTTLSANQVLTAPNATGTICLTSHTHTLSLAATGTASINLAANTVYTLTAGGSTYAFKTPVDTDTNTWRPV